MMRTRRLFSTGRFVPEIEVTNDMLRRELFKHLPDFVDKMEASSGIKTPAGMRPKTGRQRCRPARRQTCPGASR